MAKFTPLTDEQIESFGRFFSSGRASFSVITIEDKMSSNNNPMSVFLLEIMDCNGKVGKHTDYFSWVDTAVFKFYEFLKSVCHDEESYQRAKADMKAGEFINDKYLNASGECQISYYMDKEAGKEKMRLTYLPSTSRLNGTSAPTRSKGDGNDFIDDPLPF